MLPAVGCVTASAIAVATAASIAVPPVLQRSRPDLGSDEVLEATHPFCARAGSTPASTRKGGENERGEKGRAGRERGW